MRSWKISNKIEEIKEKPELQSRVAWFYYASDDGYCGYSDIMNWLDELEPYLKTEPDELKIQLADKLLNNLQLLDGRILELNMYPELKPPFSELLEIIRELELDKKDML